MKKNVLLFLSFVAFAFISCSKSKKEEQSISKTNESTIETVNEESKNVISKDNNDNIVKVLENETKVSSFAD